MKKSLEKNSYLEIKKLFDAKKFDDVISYCQKLLETDPKNILALQNISSAYNMVGAYQDAIKSASIVLEETNDDEFALKNKIFAYEKLNDYNSVLIYCNHMLIQNKKDVDTLITKGITLNKIGNHDDAI